MTRVSGSISYNRRTSEIELMAHLEVDGVVKTDAKSCVFKVFQSNASQLGSDVTDSAPDANGVFRGELSATLSSAIMYYVEIAITAFDDSVYSTIIYVVAER